MREGFTPDNTFVFTYIDKEPKFQSVYAGRTAHFNGIKGSNDYITADCIAQVGLNRRQPVDYLVERLARNEELLDEVRSLSPEESRVKLAELSWSNEDIVTGYILADIEQNMFRSAIRETDNQREVTFCLFYERSSMPHLKEKIEERYVEHLGAAVEVVEEEEITRNTERKLSAADKIMAWYTEWNGEPVKMKTVYTELNINRVTFYKAIVKNNKLSKLLAEAREKAREAKKPEGYIMK